MLRTMTRLYLIIMVLFHLSCSTKPSPEVNSAEPDSEKKFGSKCEELDHVDKQMLDLHEAIKQSYAEDPKFLRRLMDAQVYWIQYKDRHIKSIYPLDSKYYKRTFGPDYNECKCAEAARLTRLRIEELKLWVEGVTAIYEDCPTSFNPGN